MAMAFFVTATSWRAVVAASVPSRLPNPFLVLLSQAARPCLRLGAARPTRLRVPLAASNVSKMYVGNLSWKVDDSRLVQMFSEHGKVAFAKVVWDFHTGRSKGFGFVAMVSQEEMDNAIAALNGQILEGLALEVSAAEKPDVTVNKAAPRGARVESPPRDNTVGPSFRMYVSNLSWKVDDSKLVQMFSEHGKVAFAKVVRDFHTGRSKGFGFVAMASQEEMDNAITALNGHVCG